MSSKTDAVIDTLAATVVQARSSCLATALNQALLAAADSNNVVVRNVRVTQAAFAQTTCRLDTTVDNSSLVSDLRDALANVVQGTDLADVSKFRDEVTFAVSQSFVNDALADAVNAYTATASGGSINFVNLNITQIATARVRARILTDARTRDGRLLRDYIAQSIDQYDVRTPDGTLVGCGTDPYRAVIIGSAAAAAVILAACIGIALIIR